MCNHQKNFTVAKTDAGIYNVTGDILPIQIIDSRKLSAEDNTWLKNLSNRLNVSAFMQIENKINRLNKSVHVLAYFDAITRANNKILLEVMKMGKTQLSYLEMLEKAGLLAEIKVRLLDEVKAGLLDEVKANYAENEYKNWQSIIAEKDAEIASLRAQLNT